jgi:hypothetical protein
MADTPKKQMHKVIITLDDEKQRIKVDYRPKLDRTNLKDVNLFINATYTGMNMSLKMLLQDAPVLRPASELEQEAHTYVFKDVLKDNQLYRSRKALHDSIASGFNTLLKELFPDIQYIEQWQKAEQERVFEMSSEEAEERRIELARVAEQVRKGEESCDSENSSKQDENVEDA